MEIQEGFTLKWGNLILRIDHAIDKPVVNRTPAGLPESFAQDGHRRQGGRSEDLSPLRGGSPFSRFQEEPEKLRRPSVNLKHFRSLHFIGQEVTHRRVVE